jgi:hypothetical protein
MRLHKELRTGLRSMLLSKYDSLFDNRPSYLCQSILEKALSDLRNVSQTVLFLGSSRFFREYTSYGWN